MSTRAFTIHVDGHPGHRGNVLAHALSAKLQRLLIALAQLERTFSGAGQRQTDYEIVAASKASPTRLVLKPVPKAANYDPLPAFNWTFEQLEKVATGGALDERVDATTAENLATLAEHRKEEDYSRFWLSIDGIDIPLDESFRDNSLRCAAEKRSKQADVAWYEGDSFGSVTGTLRQIGDLEGAYSFVITPAVGAEQIACSFAESDRDKMGKYLFKNVRVHGKLRYKQSSPFPFSVEMREIELATDHECEHLSDLRGLFKDSSYFTFGDQDI
ncbi:hypothetical protein [Methylobacterium sp. J-070]|uniref:hypothetical protein n=1 Tax=Methylobacterium sp. J-070 TaxID=2836650 RepID=UPI001FB95425|nr:hypothetical protein [Methylobacterium sp. J-070]MCJ2053923.1 hypothetical protein [Methylobacterium sp. J-070]